MPDQSTFKTSISSLINPQISPDGEVAYSETKDGRTHFILTDKTYVGISITNDADDYLNLMLAENGKEILKRSIKASSGATVLFPRGNGGEHDIHISSEQDVKLELTAGNKVFQPTKYEVTVTPEAKNVEIVNNTAGSAHELTSETVVKIPVTQSEKPFFAVKFDEKLTQETDLNRLNELDFKKLSESNFKELYQSGVTTKIGNTEVLFPIYAENDPRSKAEFKVELYDPKDPSKTSTLAFRGGIPVNPETNEPIFKINDPKEAGMKELVAAYQQALENQTVNGGFEIKKATPVLALNLDEAISQARSGLQQNGVRLTGDNNELSAATLEAQVQQIKESASQPLSVEAAETIDSSVAPKAKPAGKTQTTR